MESWSKTILNGLVLNMLKLATLGRFWKLMRSMKMAEVQGKDRM